VARQHETGEAEPTERDGNLSCPLRSPRQRETARDARDVRRMAHDPEVEGSKSLPRHQGQRPFLEQRKGLLHEVAHDRVSSDDLPTQWLAFDVLPDLVILLTMTVLPLGDVKSHLSELVSRVHDYHERVTVTVHGRPSAVLIAPEDLERLEETLEIMRDAATMNRLAESDAELARGEHVSAEELAEAMRQRRGR
jgi:antitoxin YefM